jgi:HK97 gp10 family phage protein
MAAVEIKITNIREIKAAFIRAPGLMTQELNTAIKKSILSIQAKSMLNTPVATGRLRASHTSTFGDLKGTVGTNTKYDIFVHDGTRYMRPRPYLKDAVESSVDTTNRFFKEAVEKVLDKIGSLT